MSDFYVSSIKPDDYKTLSIVDEILAGQDLKRDNGLDTVAVVRNSDDEIIATGSALGNTFRCFAVREEYKGAGLLNLLVTYLMDIQIKAGNSLVFLYTKPSSAHFFESLGFYEIVRVDGKLVFMENRRGHFDKYISEMCKKYPGKRVGAIVMNANPFTKGHRFLIEQALKDCDFLHLFLVSEEKSDLECRVRKELVLRGVSDLDNIIIHDSGPYIISNATFPSYFLKNEEDIMNVHASLDVSVFAKIAEAVGINVRYAGSEPFSRKTAIYNDVMTRKLPENNIEFVVFNRLENNGKPISASDARDYIRNKDFKKLEEIVVLSTLDYFLNEFP